MPKLTQKRLKELLHYDPETGVFTWKVVRPSIKIGDAAGCKTKRGYMQVSVDGKRYLVHRLCWLYEKGYLPEHDIDHIDRVKYHNQVSNLREVSRQCNLRNTGNQSNNTSSVNGVSWDKTNMMWMAAIRVNRKYRFLGRYKSFCDAVCARLAGEQCLNWSICDYSSPAYKYVRANVQNV